MTRFAALARGTAMATSLRTVAKGCERLRTVADGNAASGEQVYAPPDLPSKTKRLRYAFGKHIYLPPAEKISRLTQT